MLRADITRWVFIDGGETRKLDIWTSVPYVRRMPSESDRVSNLERRQTRAVRRDALPAVLALVASEALVASLELDADSNQWHLVLSLIPLLPAAWLGLVQLRSLRRSDEFQRIAQLEAMSVGFAAAMFVALTGGLLAAADVGSSVQFLQLTFIVGILCWVAALAIRSRR